MVIVSDADFVLACIMRRLLCEQVRLEPEPDGSYTLHINTRLKLNHEQLSAVRSELG